MSVEELLKSMDAKELVKRFRIRLIEQDISIKNFTEKNGLNYQYFVQAINDTINMKEEYRTLIEKFLQETD